MGERFVVVPVDGGVRVAGEGDHSEAVVADPAPDPGGSSSAGTVEGKEAEGQSEPQDPNAVVPILEYNREPNKYGKTAACEQTHGLVISSVYERINRRISLGLSAPVVM